MLIAAPAVSLLAAHKQLSADRLCQLQAADMLRQSAVRMLLLQASLAAGHKRAVALHCTVGWVVHSWKSPALADKQHEACVKPVISAPSQWTGL
jgi:hypothetical protein